MDKIVRLEQINKAYQMGKNSLPVLKNIQMTVDRGEYLAILGASGSGKSTLMNILGCMDTADTGNYFLEDVEVASCSDAELTRLRNQKIGFIFQKYHLIPQYTIMQNVILPLLNKGMSRRVACEQAGEVIRMVGLSDRMGHRPGELSGGQQQRVAIARALVNQPSLLLADEPTGALDSETGKEILKLFEELNQQGNTIIMITHDKKVAEHSGRIVSLVDGILQDQ